MTPEGKKVSLALEYTGDVLSRLYFSSPMLVASSFRPLLGKHHPHKRMLPGKISPNSPSGHKRSRARSMSRLRSALGKEEIEEEDSTSVRGSPRAKRQRRAQSPVKSPERPLSKLTKTEVYFSLSVSKLYASPAHVASSQGPRPPTSEAR
jgi:hypothetical protein